MEFGFSKMHNCLVKYTLKPLPPGNYNITVTATGYNDFEDFDVQAKLGTNTHDDVELIKT